MLGESWRHGVVILAWDSAVAGASDPDDGQNVLILEFAHQLDTASGPADGTPCLPDVDHDGTTDHAEFFAVATEAFFERADLQQERPELYQALRHYYRQDPGAPAGVEA